MLLFYLFFSSSGDLALGRCSCKLIASPHKLLCHRQLPPDLLRPLTLLLGSFLFILHFPHSEIFIVILFPSFFFFCENPSSSSLILNESPLAPLCWFWPFVAASPFRDFSFFVFFFFSAMDGDQPSPSSFLSQGCVIMTWLFPTFSFYSAFFFFLRTFFSTIIPFFVQK